MKAKTMGLAAKRTAAVLMAALLAVTALLGAFNGGQTAYAAQTATLVDSGERFDFRQYDSNTDNSWADSRFVLDGEDAYCIDITTTAYEGSTYTARSMDSGMALRIGLYKKYLDEEKSGWSYLKRGGYLQYMIWCEYTPGYMDSYVTPENGDFYDVYAAAKAYYEDNKANYEAEGTEWTSSDSQSMCVTPKLTPKGTIEVHKSSAIAKTTDGNSCYSLEGAVYTVYSDEGCTAAVGSIETDADGNGKLEHVTHTFIGLSRDKYSPAPG